MRKKKDDTPTYVLRVTIPIADTVAAEWVSRQVNAQSSIRMLIHQAAATHGMRDYLSDIAFDATGKAVVAPSDVAASFVAPAPAAVEKAEPEPQESKTETREPKAKQDAKAAESDLDLLGAMDR